MYGVNNLSHSGWGRLPNGVNILLLMMYQFLRKGALKKLCILNLWAHGADAPSSQMIEDRGCNVYRNILEGFPPYLFFNGIYCTTHLTLTHCRSGFGQWHAACTLPHVVVYNRIRYVTVHGFYLYFSFKEQHKKEVWASFKHGNSALIHTSPLHTKWYQGGPFKHSSISHVLNKSTILFNL